MIGIKHEDLGEEIGAAVALKHGARAETEELKEFVRGRLAAYKYPREVWIVDSLPKGPLPHLFASDDAQVVSLSPPINLAPHWLGRFPAYALSKYGMNRCRRQPGPAGDVRAG